VLVDTNARFKRRKPNMVPQTLYGQLRHIFLLRVDAAEILHRTEPETVVFAVIRSCKIEASHPTLDMHWINSETNIDVVDLNCVQCIVGRVPGWHGQMAVVDRSGSLARAMWDSDD
jgi:hypothetical protein